MGGWRDHVLPAVLTGLWILSSSLTCWRPKRKAAMDLPSCTHECTGGALLIRCPVQPCASTATETANRVQRTWLPKYDKYIYK